MSREVPLVKVDFCGHPCEQNHVTFNGTTNSSVSHCSEINTYHCASFGDDHCDDHMLESIERDTRFFIEHQEGDLAEGRPFPNRQPRFSTVAMDILRAKEDRDIHPYGRGGRYEGVLYGQRKVTVQLDHTKFLAWVIFVGFLFLVSVAIIVLAEIDRHQYHTSSNNTTTA